MGKIEVLIKIAIQKINTNELSDNASLEKHLKNSLISRAIYHPNSLTHVEKLLVSKLEFNDSDKKEHHLVSRALTSPLALLFAGATASALLKSKLPIKSIPFKSTSISPNHIISSMLTFGVPASMLATRNAYAASNIKKLLDNK